MELKLLEVSRRLKIIIIIMKKQLLFILVLGILFTCQSVGAKELNLLPLPQECTFNKGQFVISKLKLQTPLLEANFTRFIEENGGVIDAGANSKITVNLVSELKNIPLNRDEAYTLSVNSREVVIEAETERGVYWALQTLTQLVETKGKRKIIKACEITDWPAFRVRGFMQDVGRSYVSLKELKEEIAALSRYKINVFHWHLTENQAWRLESKIFPMLTDSVNMTRFEGQYYTMEEAKELVAFCKAHNVLLIPEFDMPGHSAAFIRAFRHDMQSPEGMIILKLLMDEICENLDVPYIHIGTDEAAFKNPTFVSDMVAHVRAHGKKVISWSPGWSYKPGEIDMTHLWSYRAKAQKGIAAVDSKFHYLNHFDTFGDIVALYNSRIYNSAIGSEDLAGVILAIWNDRIVLDERDNVRQNNFYPNMLAIAERAWRGGGTEYFDKKGVILAEESSVEFKEFADFERRMLWHKSNNFKGYPFSYVKQTNVKWRITDAFPNNGELSKVFPPEQSLESKYTYEGEEYATTPVTGAGIYLRHVWGSLVPAFFKDPKENHTAYAYTWVYSPKQQKVGMWIEFQNYGRSEMDLPPLAGTWDYKGSKIWLNDKEIAPPAWSAKHTVRSNETPLENENCVVRDPIAVDLNKGWNKVFLKLPVGRFSTNEVRLVKWMFTTVFVTLDGESEVKELIYSPDKIK